MSSEANVCVGDLVLYRMSETDWFVDIAESLCKKGQRDGAFLRTQGWAPLAALTPIPSRVSFGAKLWEMLETEDSKRSETAWERTFEEATARGLNKSAAYRLADNAARILRSDVNMTAEQAIALTLNTEPKAQAG